MLVSSRVGTYSQDLFLQRDLKQKQLQFNTLDFQTLTNQKTDQYSDLFGSISQLLGLEHNLELQKQYKKDNSFLSDSLKLMSENALGLEKSIKDFSRRLLQFQQDGGVTNNQQIPGVQEFAYNTLKSIQSYLNTRILGKYQFGGTTSMPPIDLHLGDTLADFQKLFDGDTVPYPITSASHVAKYHATPNDLLSWAEFDAAGSRIIDNSAKHAFKNLKVGQSITVDGTVSNDGAYKIKAVGPNGDWIEVETKKMTIEPATPATTEIVDPHNSKDTKTVGSFSIPDRHFFPQADHLGDPKDAVIQAGPPNANKGVFSKYKIGDTLKIKGANNAGNNREWIITGIDQTGNFVTVRQKYLVDEGSAAHPYFDKTPNSIILNDNGLVADTATSAPGTFLLPNNKPLPSGTQLDMGNGLVYTVDYVSPDGSTVTFMPGDQVVPSVLNMQHIQSVHAAATFSSTGYYKGNIDPAVFHIDDNVDLYNNVTGISPGFEKAIRAMGILAQGNLEAHPERLKQAIYLVDSALGNNNLSTKPPAGIGHESSETLEDAISRITFLRSTLKHTQTHLTSAIDSKKDQIGHVEMVNKLETAAQFKHLQQLLKASFLSSQRAGQLSLVNYM